jgi:adenylate cyclase
MAEERAHRRLAAILAADVVGYSRLMEQNEDGTLAHLSLLRKQFIEPLVAEHHGRIVKLMGDGTLCEFASVVDAVHCAVLIQQGMAEREKEVSESERMQLRIGINTGDVIVEEGDIYGGGVNVAARLEQICEPGNVLVSGAAYDQLYGRSELALDFVGEQQVKNIDRAVRIYRANPAGAPSASPRPISQRPAEQPVLAVLPFANLSGDPKWERLADGISGDIITDLTRLHDFLVIARNSSFAYKTKAVDVRQVGKELGVRYVLEGSLQASGEKVRVTAELVDTATGAHVWAARYERLQGDLFAIQDEVTEQVVNTIGGWGGRLAGADRDAVRRRPPASLEAYDLYLLGIEQKHRFSKEGIAEAIRLFSRAVDLDPEFARAWTSLSLAHSVAAANGFTDDPPGEERRSRECIERAIVLDPSDPKARICIGDLRAHDGDFTGAAEEFRHARAVSLGEADALALLGSSLSLTIGDPFDGAELVRRAIRLNPSTPSWYFSTLGRAEFVCAAYSKSIATLAQAPRQLPATLLFLAIAHAQLNDIEETRKIVARLNAEFPTFTVEGFIHAFPVTNPLALVAIRQGASKACLLST